MCTRATKWKPPPTEAEGGQPTEVDLLFFVGVAPGETQRKQVLQLYGTILRKLEQQLKKRKRR